MCTPQAPLVQSLIRAAHAIAAPVTVLGRSSHGSRRRKLWELDGHAHCPVLGVCLPIAALRKLVGKAPGAIPAADDYELHCAAVADCKQGGAIAEAVQRELDQRYAQALRQAARLKSTEGWPHGGSRPCAARRKSPAHCGPP